MCTKLVLFTRLYKDARSTKHKIWQWILLSVPTSCEGQPAVYCIHTRSPFLGVKPPRREAVHSTPCSADVRTILDLYFALTFPLMPSWRGPELRKKINCCSVLKLFVHGYPVLGLLNTRITLSLYVVKIWRDSEWGNWRNECSTLVAPPF